MTETTARVESGSLPAANADASLPGGARLDRFSAAAVLAVFGLTWPVMELLANNAEFFIARRADKGEILGLAIVLLIVVPAVIGLLATLPGRPGSWVAAALMTVSATSIAFLGLRRLPAEWWLTLTGAVVLGAGFTWLFWRSERVRQGARYLLVAPLAIIVFFLLVTPAGAVLRDSGSTVGWPVGVTNPAPIVFVVLDEFPVASIIDPDGDLRADRYPNLARLAADGYWYPNAVTVQQQTEHSVPAMLSGANPEQALIPFAGQYPNTIFTALGGTYDFYVYEAITQLCPVTLCENVIATKTPISRDVAVVAGHLLLPEPLTEDLPSIESSWGSFENAGAFEPTDEFREIAGNRLEPIHAFLADIQQYAGPKPPLFYLHALIPHHAWEYLPDGTSYPLLGVSTPGSEGGGWIEDDFLVAQGMQRHLLQVGYADHIVGDIIDSLTEAGIYEDSLMVVVADHGISIKPGVSHQRKITDDTVGEIAAIPLFVKPPGSMEGVVDDRRALTTDILPTIADIIGAEIPWSVDGSSLLGPALDRTESATTGPDRSVTYGTSGEEKLETAARIERWFPGGDPWALLPEGSPDLVGQTIDVSSLPASAAFTVQLIDPELFENVSLESGRLPLRVGARVGGYIEGDELVAVAVNGTVGAVTRTYVDEDGSGFMAMIPPDLLVDGLNEIGVILIAQDGSLSRLRFGSGSGFVPPFLPRTDT